MAYRVCVGSLSIIAANEGEALEVFKELSKHNARVIIRDDKGARWILTISGLCWHGIGYSKSLARDRPMYGLI